MKKMFVLLMLFAWENAFTQEVQESQLEQQAERDEGEQDDDYILQQLEYFKKHPINLNKCSIEELRSMSVFSELQLTNFILYRNQFDKFISIYEMQAIPGWDIELIRKILPFVTIKEDIKIISSFGKQLKEGEHQLLLRIAFPLVKPPEYLLPDSVSGSYSGSPIKLWIRYRYQFKRALQFGFSAEKDAGEDFFKGLHKMGFDFYSFHLFKRSNGPIKAFAIGDYTINLGQGLIQWQSMSFKKSSLVLAIKREGDMLRPYNSAGEYAFYRGAAIDIRKRNWEVLGFASMRNLSANLREDSLKEFESYVSSISSSGYHRTKNEIEDRSKIQMIVFGTAIRYAKSKWRIGINAIHYELNRPIRKDPEPYNLFSFSGKNLSNLSFDYDYTTRNIHLFGEFAMDDQSKKTAIFNGALISLDRRIDLALLFRRISPAYQSFFANAFTENTQPVNENGFYTGISIRPFPGWAIDAYCDLYRFPWLRYRVNAMSEGHDYLVMLGYKPSKQTEIYLRFKAESKPINESGILDPVYKLINPIKKDWRFQLNHKLNESVLLRTRVNILSIQKENDGNQVGFLWFTDLIYKPLMKTYSGNIRIQYFESDSYDSRIYAYENDVAFTNSIPSFSGRGYRLYINAIFDIKHLCQLRNKINIDLWIKAAQTIADHRFVTNGTMSGTSGKNIPELKFQLALGW